MISMLFFKKVLCALKFRAAENSLHVGFEEGKKSSVGENASIYSIHEHVLLNIHNLFNSILLFLQYIYYI